MLHDLQKHGWKTEIESMMVSVWWEEITQITPDLVECDIWYEETCKINKRKTTDSVECDSWFEKNWRDDANNTWFGGMRHLI